MKKLFFLLISAACICSGYAQTSENGCDTLQCGSKNALHGIVRMSGGYLTSSRGGGKIFGHRVDKDYKGATSDGWYGSVTADWRVSEQSIGLVGVAFNYGQPAIHNLGTGSHRADLYSVGLRGGVVVPFFTRRVWMIMAAEAGAGHLQSQEKVDGHYYHTSLAGYMGGEISLIYKISQHWGVHLSWKESGLFDRTIQHGDNAAAGNQKVYINSQQLGAGISYCF